MLSAGWGDSTPRGTVIHYFRNRHCKRAMLQPLEPIQRSVFQQRAQPLRRRCPIACGISPTRRAIRGWPRPGAEADES